MKEEAAKRPGRFAVWASHAVPLVLALSFLTRLWDRDLWWHLGTGRYIVEHGRVPDRDPFSYTAPGEPWAYVTSGADVLLYLVEHHLGVLGLGVLEVLVAWGMLASLSLSSRLAGASRAAAAAAVVSATVLVQWRYALLRPGTFGAALLALTCALLLLWWRRPERRWLAVVIGVTAIWPSIHATALLAPVLLFVTFVAALVTRERRDRLLDLGAAVLAAIAAIALMPSGRGAVASTYAHMSSPDLTIFISEWAPGDPRSPRLWLPLLFGAIGLVLARRSLVRSPLPAAFWALGIALTTRGVRNHYEAILLGVPLAALGIDAAATGLAEAGLALAAWSVFVVWPLGTLAALLLLESGPLLATWWGIGNRVEYTPEDCVNVLRTLPAGRVLNDLDTGGYLIWRGIPVFADGRALHSYTREHFERWFIPAFGSPQGMLAAADAFGVSYGLGLQRKSLGQMMMSSPDWIPVFHGMECSLFVRPAAAATVVRAGRPLLEEVRGVYQPDWMRRFYESVLATPAGRRNLEAALQRVRRESPTTPVLPVVEDTVRELLSERAASRAPGKAPPVSGTVP